jgi:hypothetical protein
MARKLEPGRYIAMDVCSGKVLDLALENNQPPYAWGYHGEENQQVRAIIAFLTLGLQELTRPPFQFLPSAVVMTYCVLSLCIVSGTSALAAQGSPSTAFTAAAHSSPLGPI